VKFSRVSEIFRVKKTFGAWMAARGKDRLSESSGSLNNERVFQTAECEALRNSMFLLQRYEKHEHVLFVSLHQLSTK